MDDKKNRRHSDDNGSNPVERLGEVQALLRRLDLATGDTGLPAGPLLDALTTLRIGRDEIEQWEPRLVEAARAAGASWTALAPVLGVGSRQAAERRFLRRHLSASGEATGEGRVRAERKRRAGDRAVRGWARDHAALLRGLAGQVGHADGLSTTGRRRAAQVREALSTDDPAQLLGPLADTEQHLGDGHEDLTGQIRDLGERADGVRGRARREEP